MMAVELKKQGMVRMKDLVQANGEAVLPQSEKYAQEALTIPDEASLS
jgi:hypothetical protein